MRQPDEAADFTDRGRRKMPALMCGADNNYLALTWRQIHTIEKAASDPPPSAAAKPAAVSQRLTPRNLSAQIHHEAKGNPISSRPITSVANCCPGLEVDFRAVWRRLFKGIELREYDNLVVRVDPDEKTVAGLQGKRLLRVWVGPDTEDAFLTMTKIYGPASSDPDGRIELTTEHEPRRAGAAGMVERPRLCARFRKRQRKHGQPVKVRCDFSKEDGWDQQQPLIEATDATETEPATPANYVSRRPRGAPVFRGRHGGHFASPGRSRRTHARPLLALAERLPRVLVLLLGVGAAGLRQRRRSTPAA